MTRASPPLVVTALITLITLIAMIVLYVMGRDLICACGTVKLWGGNAPLTESSKHLLDWYSPSHLLHGFLFFGLLWLVARRVPLGWRLVIATLIEACWEVLENTPMIINTYRELPAGAGYSGDSVINSFMDICLMVLGFWLASRLPVWLSVLIIVGFEALTIWLIRDGLALNILMLIYPIDAVAIWQTGG